MKKKASNNSLKKSMMKKGPNKVLSSKMFVIKRKDIKVFFLLIFLIPFFSTFEIFVKLKNLVFLVESYGKFNNKHILILTVKKTRVGNS